MSSRWFIPASLAIFGGFVALIWLYLASFQPLPTPAAANGDSDIDQELAALTTPTRRDAPPEKFPAGDITVGKMSELGHDRGTEASLPARLFRDDTPTLRQLGEHLDEASVQFRNDVSRTAIAQEARGRSAAAGGNHEAALRHLDEALRKNPRDTAALSAKAASLVALEHFADAAGVYRELVKLAPHDTTARYNYAVVLWRLAHFAAAARELREVVRLAPDHADAHYNLASLAQRDGRLIEARRSWEAFTALRPDVPSGWFNRGVVCMDFDEPAVAADAFARFTELSPNDPDGWVNLALAEAASDHLDVALYALSIADDLAPCEALTLDLLAQIHELLAERDPSSAEEHRVAAARIRELLGPAILQLETVAARENN
jgi:tetratricopeptide (TPR) repeat protein